MRSQFAVKSNTKSVRIAIAMLLAGVASGCSSDVTRFDGLFGSKPDQLTTNSIPHQVNAINGKLPVPKADLRDGTRGQIQDVSGDAALNQPLPPATSDYDSISTSTTGYSPARAAVRPIRVERSDLKSPTVSREEKVALAQPMPTRIETGVTTPRVNADEITTGTTPSMWSVQASSPRVEVRSGQTLSGIAARYNVPQSEILKANRLKSGADLKYGTTLVIPVKGGAASTPVIKVAKVEDKKIPVPVRMPEQDKAILPSSATLRDKAKSSSNTNVAGDNKENGAGAGGRYQVVAGDSLAKIARDHNVSVDDLKRANGLSTASIRIGQTLAIPAPGQSDTIKTASVPTTSKVKETAADKPKAYTPPVADKSVEEVQKTADTGQKAPEDTGISKYRWPVRGAVIAGYGQNVDGVRNPGIDISVPEGTPVKAAENGVVIYSGAGLKDLGNTVLVRHDDGTVTVYGNAASLSVKRGEKVTRGQTIATSGMSGGAKRPKLHFEVRQKSEPVNPLTFLR